MRHSSLDGAPRGAVFHAAVSDGSLQEFEQLRASLVHALDLARAMREPTRLVDGMTDFVAHMDACYAAALRFVDGAGDDLQRADLIALFDEVRREWSTTERIAAPHLAPRHTKAWAEQRRLRRRRTLAARG